MLRREFMEAAAGAVLAVVPAKPRLNEKEVKELDGTLSSAAITAVKTLAALCDDHESAFTRLQASRTILEFAKFGTGPEAC